MQNLRRLGVIGDVHTEARALDAALDFLRSRGVDAIACVGDIVDGPGDPDACCDRLQERGVLTVAGNHERWLLSGGGPPLPDATPNISEASRAFLSALPLTLTLESAAGPLLLCHGVGEDDMALLRSDTKGYALHGVPTLRDLMLDPAVEYMIGGHTHQRMVRSFHGLTVVNAGTLHRDDDPCFLEVDFEAMRIRVFGFSEGEIVPLEEIPLPAPPPVSG